MPAACDDRRRHDVRFDTSKPSASSSVPCARRMRRAVAGRIVARDFDELGEERDLALELPIDELRGWPSDRHGVMTRFINRSSRTLAARPASASVTVSSGLWLMPPLPQRTNNMPSGASPSNITASCPAPLGRWRTGIDAFCKSVRQQPLQRRRARNDRRPLQLGDLDGDAAGLFDLRDPRHARRRCARASLLFVLGADVERQVAVARNDVDGAARHVDLPDGADQPRRLPAQCLQIQRELGGGSGRIVARAPSAPFRHDRRRR